MTRPSKPRVTRSRRRARAGLVWVQGWVWEADAGPILRTIEATRADAEKAAEEKEQERE